MNGRRVPSFVLIVIVILCILLLTGISDASRILAESFFRNGVPLGINQTDEIMAEQVWIQCKEEILELAEDFKYTHSISHSQTTSNIVNKVNSDIGLLTKRIIHRAISDLPPQLKHSLHNCLGEATSPPHSYPDKVGLLEWLVNWRELLSDWSTTGTRRFLLRKSHGKHHKHRHSHSHKHKHRNKHRPRKHRGSPRRAAAPRPAEAPAPGSVFPPGPPVHAPQPFVKKSPPPLPAMRHRQPHSPPPPPPHKTSKSKSHAKDTNTAIIVASCTAAFALILLLFCYCCYLRRRRNNNGHRNGHRDDRPLLNCCSNLSTGSSQASPNLGNTQTQELNPSAYVNSMPVRTGNSLAEHLAAEPPLGAPGNTNAPLLPLPPGRTAPPHGMVSLLPGKSAPPPPNPPPPPAPKAPPPPPPLAPKAPPPPAPKAPAPKAPPPPKAGRPSPPNPPKPGGPGRTPLGGEETSAADNQKAKLKPFFWDKVLAKPDHSMVWHDLKAGSFQFNEEMMENLFGYNTVEKNKNDHKKDPTTFEAPQYIQIIDPRKAQNLSILLRALNVTTEEVCDAVMEGNELPAELIQTMLKMAPTTDEELKLRLYSGELSQLGPAERFLKALVDIPFAFKRLESLLFMCTIQEEASTVKESFATLEVACKELKNSRVFLKLLEAVLKTGNRMNDGTYRGGAQAFKLDTLLKLSDVKGIDGKTTLLHFVVLEIIRSEGIRAARRAKENHSVTSVQTEDLLEDSTQESTEYYRFLGLEIVSNLSNELANVKKAAVIDADMLTTTASKLGHSLKKAKDFLNNEMNSVDDKSEFRDTLASFVQQAEEDVIWMLEEEKKITSLVKSTADYFHGTPGKDEGLRLFVIVRDFLVMVDKVCLEVKNSTVNPIKVAKKEAASSSSAPGELQRDPSTGSSSDSGELRRDASRASSASGEAQQSLSPSSSIQHQLFPAIKDRRKDDSSSDDES